MKQLLCLLALCAATAVQGLASPAVNAGAGVPKSSASRSAAVHPGRVLSDAQIERNVRARLARSKMSLKEHFTVSVKDGVATLEGKTNVMQHKGVATRLARLGGARAVQNHIAVSAEAKAKAAARLARYRAGAAGSGPPARARVLPPAR